MTPVDLQEWMNENKPGEEMYWYRGFFDQAIFVRDELGWMFKQGQLGKDRAPVTVVSTHTSKSILLPVYHIETARGITLRMRYNFFNWVISVKSNHDVPDNFGTLFDRVPGLNPIYAEGFKEHWVFSPYAQNHREFTVVLHSDYDVYTFCWLLRTAS